MSKQTFIIPTENENVKKRFSLNIPLDKYVKITTLVGKKAAEGKITYSLKDAIAEGLELLQNQYPAVSKEEGIIERRYYKGGKQKTKVESFSTSSMMHDYDIIWINNFIGEKRKENQFFSKTDFVIDLVETLEKKYSNLK